MHVKSFLDKFVCKEWVVEQVWFGRSHIFFFSGFCFLCFFLPSCVLHPAILCLSMQNLPWLNIPVTEAYHHWNLPLPWHSWWFHLCLFSPFSLILQQCIESFLWAQEVPQNEKDEKDLHLWLSSHPVKKGPCFEENTILVIQAYNL